MRVWPKARPSSPARSLRISSTSPSERSALYKGDTSPEYIAWGSLPLSGLARSFWPSVHHGSRGYAPCQIGLAVRGLRLEVVLHEGDHLLGRVDIGIGAIALRQTHSDLKRAAPAAR